MTPTLNTLQRNSILPLRQFPFMMKFQPTRAINWTLLKFQFAIIAVLWAVINIFPYRCFNFTFKFPEHSSTYKNYSNYFGLNSVHFLNGSAYSYILPLRVRTQIHVSSSESSIKTFFFRFFTSCVTKTRISKQVLEWPDRETNKILRLF